MGILGKLFASKKADLTKAAAQAENAFDKKISKDLIEGVISGSLLVSFADGTCDDEEIQSLCALLDAEESFLPWQSEIPALIEKYSKQLRAGITYGKMKALKELADLKGDENAALCFACIETVAQQGGISDDEKAMLKDIAGALGVAYRG